MKQTAINFTLQKLFSEISTLHDQTKENVKVSNTKQRQSNLSKSIHTEIEKIRESLVNIKNLTKTITQKKTPQTIGDEVMAIGIDMGIDVKTAEHAGNMIEKLLKAGEITEHHKLAARVTEQNMTFYYKVIHLLNNNNNI